MTTGARADGLPAVVVPHGFRSIPFLQLAAAAEGICRIVWLVDPDDAETRALRRLLERIGPVVDLLGADVEEVVDAVSPFEPEAVLSFRDEDLVPAADLAAALGLRFHSPAVARRLADKLLQRRALGDGGLEVPAAWELPDPADDRHLAHLAPTLPYPVIVKPRQGSGSRHTFLARDPRELLAGLRLVADAAAAVGTPEPMLVEEYLPSSDVATTGPFADYVSVETLATTHGLVHVAVTGRTQLAAPFRETGFFLPSHLGEPETAAVLATATDALRALGVTTGCTHTEVKLTPAGPRVLEVNGRMGGGIHDLLLAASGRDLLVDYLRSALGLPVDLHGLVTCQRVGYRFFYQPPLSARRVTAIGGLSAIAALDGVADVALHRSPGDPVDAHDGTRTYLFAVVGAAADAAGVAATRRRVHELAEVAYETGPAATTARPRELGAGPAIEVALVNNMPDAAFTATERQFRELVQAAAGDRRLVMRLCSLPDPRRGDTIRRQLDDRYESLEALRRRPPDALIVTGSEPSCRDLREEPSWEDLTALLAWAERSTSSVLLSCLAAHGALLATDGLQRRRLPGKLSGVFPQWVDRGHPLVAGVGPVAFPHSRLHEVAPHALEARGYRVVVGSDEVGWSVAARDGACLRLLVQGHPEYDATTLLREYRRDVRRYLVGEQEDYPDIPTGYLGTEAAGRLRAFRRDALAAAASGHAARSRLAERFPFDPCAERLRAEWRAPMVHLLANWLSVLETHKAEGTSQRAG